MSIIAVPLKSMLTFASTSLFEHCRTIIAERSEEGVAPTLPSGDQAGGVDLRILAAPRPPSGLTPASLLTRNLKEPVLEARGVVKILDVHQRLQGFNRFQKPGIQQRQRPYTTSGRTPLETTSTRSALRNERQKRAERSQRTIYPSSLSLSHQPERNTMIRTRHSRKRTSRQNLHTRMRIRFGIWARRRAFISSGPRSRSRRWKPSVRAESSSVS